jgi:hypothetical protein
MFIERRVNSSTGRVELWRCQWVNQPGSKPHKEFVDKIGDEQDMTPTSTSSEVAAICWSWGRTLGNIAVHSESLLGSFPDRSGDDAQLPCSFVDAGKFRHGPDRWWCSTHQTHWGTKGDVASFANTGVMRCANHTQPMSYVVAPETIDLQAHAEVGLWCSMPAALSTDPTDPTESRAPRLHLHIREVEGSKDKDADRDLDAVSLLYGDKPDLFGKAITRVNITPPAAFEFVCGLEAKREMSCVNCVHCGYPHLDLGDFARKPHRKHFCGNCGRDSTVSTKPIVSTPLKPLHDLFARDEFQVPDRVLNLDDHKDCTYTVWASTPAIIWTAHRRQELGIHVHVHRGGKRIEDDTFGSVILDGKALDRAQLFQRMVEASKV